MLLVSALVSHDVSHTKFTAASRRVEVEQEPRAPKTEETGRAVWDRDEAQEKVENAETNVVLGLLPVVEVRKVAEYRNVLADVVNQNIRPQCHKRLMVRGVIEGMIRGRINVPVYC